MTMLNTTGPDTCWLCKGEGHIALLTGTHRCRACDQGARPAPQTDRARLRAMLADTVAADAERLGNLLLDWDVITSARVSWLSTRKEIEQPLSYLVDTTAHPELVDLVASIDRADGDYVAAVDSTLGGIVWSLSVEISAITRRLLNRAVHVRSERSMARLGLNEGHWRLLGSFVAANDRAILADLAEYDDTTAQAAD